MYVPLFMGSNSVASQADSRIDQEMIVRVFAQSEKGKAISASVGVGWPANEAVLVYSTTTTVQIRL